MHIRSLTFDDIELLTYYFISLDQDCRRLRFGSARSDSGIADYVSSIDMRSFVGIGAFKDGELIGVVELLGDGHEREAAVTILRAHRKSGIGLALVRRAIVVGEVHGWSRLVFFVEPYNHGMARLAMKAGAVKEDGCLSIWLSRASGEHDSRAARS